jgi:hypothetical protein
LTVSNLGTSVMERDVDEFSLDFRLATASTDEALTAPQMDGYTTYGTCFDSCQCYSNLTYTCGQTCTCA